MGIGRRRLPFLCLAGLKMDSHWICNGLLKNSPFFVSNHSKNHRIFAPDPELDDSWSYSLIAHV